MVERAYINIIMKYRNYFFLSNCLVVKTKYVQCTFCIMDLLVNFNSELYFKALKRISYYFKLLKLNPKLSDLILSRRKVEL